MYHGEFGNIGHPDMPDSHHAKPSWQVPTVFWRIEEKTPTVQVKVVPETLPLLFVHAAIAIAIVTREKVVLYVAESAGERQRNEDTVTCCSEGKAERQRHEDTVTCCSEGKGERHRHKDTIL